MSLTKTQITQFKQRGFTVAPAFFSATQVCAMQVEVARWLREGLFRDVSTEPQKQQNLQLIPLFPRSQLFRSLPFYPKVVEAVGSLIGTPVNKILDQCFYKPPHFGMGTHWHTDNAYFKLPDPLRGTAMWIAIHDCDRENGALKVLPDAYAKEFTHERDPASDHHIFTQQISDAEAFHCELEAGGVVFFCFGTPHATGDNPSAIGRAGVGIHFVNDNHIPQSLRDQWRQTRLPTKLGPDRDAFDQWALEIASQST